MSPASEEAGAIFVFGRGYNPHTEYSPQLRCGFAALNDGAKPLIETKLKKEAEKLC